MSSIRNCLHNCRCNCGNCQRLNLVQECVCCSEIDCVVAKNNEAVEAEGLAEPPVCITQHPGFEAVCLNRWVLQTAWYQYKQQYHDSYEGPAHKQNRHIAYRQLTRWCWGILGKQIRVFLPSCAVCCIRAHFPPPVPSLTPSVKQLTNSSILNSSSNRAQ